MRTPPHLLALRLLALLALLAPSFALAMGPDRPESDSVAEPPAFGRAARDPVPYVIVTTRALRHEFLPLARVHSRRGLEARVWTIESIRVGFPAGRDDAERIRMFLQDAYLVHGARWLLLGGDASQVPIRRATVRLGGPPPFDVVSMPTDQYYACLDGSWNANGDDRWGEVPVDSVDVSPELIVGRAPVATRAETRRFVERTVHALEGRLRPHDPRVLLAANKFGGGQFDFARFAERLRPLFEGDPRTRVTRLYENSPAWPGSEPESRAALIGALDQGPDLAVLYGQGGPGVFVTGDEFDPAQRFTSDDAGELVNHDKSIYLFSSAYTLAPDSVASIGQSLMNAPRGGAVAVLGPTCIQFVGDADRFVERVVREVYAAGVPTLGEAVFRAFAASGAHGGPGSTTRGMMLFGDPALPMSPPARVAPALAASEPGVAEDAFDLVTTAIASSSVSAPAAGQPAATAERTATPAAEPSRGARQPVDLAIRPVSADPARVEVRLELSIPAAFEGAPFDVWVFDPAGRRVRELEHGTAATGARAIAWDLHDDAGVPVRSGIYFVGVRLAGHALARRVTVVR